MSGNDSPDLAVTVAGVKMRNPIAVGPIGGLLINPRRSTPEMHAEMLLKHVEAGAGYICLPGTAHISEELLADLEKKAKPFEYTRFSKFRFMRIETEGQGREGLYMALSIGVPPKWLARVFRGETRKIIEILKQKKPQDVPLIANVIGLGAFPETYAMGAKACEEAGVDLIEVNLGCTAGPSQEGAVDDYFEKEFPLYFPGALIGDQPDLAESITRAVVQAVNIPVGIKLSPETGYPRIVEVARRVRDAGARFVTCSHCAVTIVPPDIYRSGKPKWSFMDGNPFVGGCGNWLRLIVYKQVSAIAKFVPGIDIVALGGLGVPEHIVEAMMLGAKVTPLVTDVMYDGRSLIRKHIRFLTKYMKEQGYQSVNDFIGLGLEHVKPINKIDFMPDRVFAEVDPLECSGCARCTDHVCLATYMENSVAKVKVEDR